MAQEITLHVKDMVAKAKATINELSAEEAIRLSGEAKTLIIDLRDIRERQRDGYIANSLHVPRGMLEFWIDPESPYHKSEFVEDRHFIFHCASGWRSALSASTAQNMGLNPVSHIDGGLSAWVKAGGPITKSE
ncbi:MAG: rhodanese [Rhodomicrobium sp.]|nr:MAG: rhodanese [Rhodomicrobium sp.]